MTSYKTYSLDELRTFANAESVTPINLILDRKTVDFLLSLNTCNRAISDATVDAILRSYDENGWQSSEAFSVTNNATLSDGLHRLVGLKQRDYPDGICATVIFGIKPETVTTIG